MNKSKKSILYAILSHIYEHYESSLFGFAAPFLLGLFFSPEAKSSRIGIYLSIAASFWTRPLGALILSSIGDTRGRKIALTYSIFLCISSSLLVAFLPTYETIGIWAPLCLITVRIAQGISIGGGFYATLALVSESEVRAPWKKNIIFGISLSMGFAGAILGILCASFFLSPEFPPDSWRLPFFIGAIYGLLLLLMRRMIKESPSWQSAPRPQKLIPFIDAFRYSRRNVWAVFLMGMWLLVPFYIITSWLPVHMVDIFHRQSADTLFTSSLAFIVCGIFTIFSSLVATWVRIKPFMVISGLIGFSAFVVLYLALDRQDAGLLWGSQVIIGIYTAIISGPSLLLIQRLFPIQYKFSGFAIPFSFGQALILGSTPLLCESIIHVTNKNANIAYLVLISVILSIIACLIAQPYEEKIGS